VRVSRRHSTGRPKVLRRPIQHDCCRAQRSVAQHKPSDGPPRSTPPWVFVRSALLGSHWLRQWRRQRQGPIPSTTAAASATAAAHCARAGAWAAAVVRRVARARYHPLRRHSGLHRHVHPGAGQSQIYAACSGHSPLPSLTTPPISIHNSTRPTIYEQHPFTPPTQRGPCPHCDAGRPTAGDADAERALQPL
jgi:hypothetical protein